MKYESVEMEVIVFSSEDVITDSCMTQAPCPYEMPE